MRGTWILSLLALALTAGSSLSAQSPGRPEAPVPVLGTTGEGQVSTPSPGRAWARMGAKAATTRRAGGDAAGCPRTGDPEDGRARQAELLAYDEDTGSIAASAEVALAEGLSGSLCVVNASMEVQDTSHVRALVDYAMRCLRQEAGQLAAFRF